MPVTVGVKKVPGSLGSSSGELSVSVTVTTAVPLGPMTNGTSVNFAAMFDSKGSRSVPPPGASVTSRWPSTTTITPLAPAGPVTTNCCSPLAVATGALAPPARTSVGASPVLAISTATASVWLPGTRLRSLVRVVPFEKVTLTVAPEISAPEIGPAGLLPALPLIEVGSMSTENEAVAPASKSFASSGKATLSAPKPPSEGFS